MRTLSLVFALFSLFRLSGQQMPTEKQLKAITLNELQKHIAVLASDSLEGRLTSLPGQRKAALYIADQFKAAGLLPFNDTTYFQEFPVWRWKWGEGYLQFRDITLSLNKNLIYRGSSPVDSLTGHCVFVGFGQDSIIKTLDLNNKIAFAFCKDLNHYYNIYYKLKSKGVKALIICDPDKPSSFDQALAESKSGDYKISREEPYFSNNSSKIFLVAPQVATKMFNRPLKTLAAISTAREAATVAPVPTTLNCKAIVERTETENIAAYIKGKGPETIVISAHYDHVGKKGNTIYYGADDNASGTSAIIALAKAFSQAQKSYDKNLLFLATTGEEMGLWGALEFAKRHTSLPFTIKANLNIDMIGRTDTVGKADYVYLIGAYNYPQMDSLCRKANMATNLDLDYAYDAKGSSGSLLNRSDHYAFHRLGIPVMGFFDGLHKDYHQPTDTYERIEFAIMLKRVRLIYTMLYLTAQNEAILIND